MMSLKSPISIEWEITNNYDLQYQNNITTQDDEKIENKIMEEIIVNDVLTVNITGGEPLLNPRIFDIIKKLTDANVYVGISTNGMIYKKNRQKLIKSGLKFVEVQLYGEKNIHENIRGVKGSYKKAIETLKLAKRDGLFTQMDVIITSENLENVEWCYHKALELGINKILYRRMLPNKNFEENENIMPNQEEYKNVLKKLMKLDSKKIIVSIEDPIIYALQDIKGQECLGCSAGIKSLGISKEGDIYPCIFVREKLGNIMEDSLEDIWNNNLTLQKIRSREINECKDCQYRYTCGGCRASSGVLEKDKMCPLDK